MSPGTSSTPAEDQGASIKPGDLVEVFKGPFSVRTGIVLSFEDEDVHVELELFGRMTPTRLPRSSVRKLVE